MPCIPGLKSGAFRKADAADDNSDIPAATLRLELTKSVLQADGSFDFRWATSQSSDGGYHLKASGNLLRTKNHLKLDCRCPSFAQMMVPSSRTRVPTVCVHLYDALISVTDPSVEVTNCTGAEAARLPKHPTRNHHVIDLVDDDDDDDAKVPADGTRKRRRRKAHHIDAEIVEDLPASDSRKKQIRRSATPESSSLTIEAPIKLLCTDQDQALRRQNSRDHHWSWSQCRTLRELILTRQTTSVIQWIVISNFMIDASYLLEQVPELLSIQHVVIFYQTAVGDGGLDTWKRRAFRAGQTLEMVRLNPNDTPGPTNPLRYRFFSGTHHTKLFLVGYANEDKIRVVVHTANLIRCDIHNKAQAAYMEEFPMMMGSSSTAAVGRNDYQDTLINYVKSYGYTKKLAWLGNVARRESLVDLLKCYDFSSAKAVLIPSIPGYYDLSNKENRQDRSVGHVKLKQAIASRTKWDGSRAAAVRPVVCQFSSIGTQISEKYLRELQASMDTRLARQNYKGNDDKTPLCMKFVYPTVEEIRNSVEGIIGGSSVPGRLKAVNKSFVQSRLHTWSSTTATSSSSQNPLEKPKNIPHIKTYYQPSKQGDSMDWLVVGSQNMSKQAWGEYTTNKWNQRLQLRVSSWELGVFVSPDTLGVEKLVFWDDGNDGGTRSTSGQSRTATVPMPYKMYLPEPYGDGDVAWVIDRPDMLH